MPGKFPRGAIAYTQNWRLLNAARPGDNLMRALIDKGVAARAEAFDAFCDRPRS